MRLAGDSSFGDEGVSALSSGLIGSRSLQSLDLENKVDLWGPAGTCRSLEGENTGTSTWPRECVCTGTSTVYLLRRQLMGEDVHCLRIVQAPLILDSYSIFIIMPSGGRWGYLGSWLTRLPFPD